MEQPLMLRNSVDNLPKIISEKFLGSIRNLESGLVQGLSRAEVFLHLTQGNGSYHQRYSYELSLNNPPLNMKRYGERTSKSSVRDFFGREVFGRVVIETVCDGERRLSEYNFGDVLSRSISQEQINTLGGFLANFHLQFMVRPSIQDQINPTLFMFPLGYTGGDIVRVGEPVAYSDSSESGGVGRRSENAKRLEMGGGGTILYISPEGYDELGEEHRGKLPGAILEKAYETLNPKIQYQR